MKILIDIGHPAHVHLFKNFAWLMQKKGHEILFTVREKEQTIELLEKYGFDFHSFGKHYKSTGGKIFGLFKFDLRMLKNALSYKPDVFLSHGSIYAAQIAWILRKPHISFEDTFNFEQINLYKPFTNIILTADYVHPDLGKKNIMYSGYHELAYLHKNKFKPDQNIFELINLKPGQKFVLLRFVSWEATHDKGYKGISKENKIRLFNDFSRHAKVLISSEKGLPSELEPFRIKISPERMHDVIANSNLLFSESATMASEAAILGVPAIYIDRKGRYYTKELEEKYNLIYNYTDSDSDQTRAIEKGLEILSTEGIKEIWQKKRLRLLKDKIDVTDFLVWFVENYPESVRIMREDPGYQNRFK